MAAAECVDLALAVVTRTLHNILQRLWKNRHDGLRSAAPRLSTPFMSQIEANHEITVVDWIIKLGFLSCGIIGKKRTKKTCTI